MEFRLSENKVYSVEEYEYEKSLYTSEDWEPFGEYLYRKGYTNILGNTEVVDVANSSGERPEIFAAVAGCLDSNGWWGTWNVKYKAGPVVGHGVYAGQDTARRFWENTTLFASWEAGDGGWYGMKDRGYSRNWWNAGDDEVVCRILLVRPL